MVLVTVSMYILTFEDRIKFMHYLYPDEVAQITMQS